MANRNWSQRLIFVWKENTTHVYDTLYTIHAPTTCVFAIINMIRIGELVLKIYKILKSIKTTLFMVLNSHIKRKRDIHTNTKGVTVIFTRIPVIWRNWTNNLILSSFLLHTQQFPFLKFDYHYWNRTCFQNKHFLWTTEWCIYNIHTSKVNRHHIITHISFFVFYFISHTLFPHYYFRTNILKL